MKNPLFRLRVAIITQSASLRSFGGMIPDQLATEIRLLLFSVEDQRALPNFKFILAARVRRFIQRAKLLQHAQITFRRRLMSRTLGDHLFDRNPLALAPFNQSRKSSYSILPQPRSSKTWNHEVDPEDCPTARGESEYFQVASCSQPHSPRRRSEEIRADRYVSQTRPWQPPPADKFIRFWNGLD
jgi:hypothetical protein